MAAVAVESSPIVISEEIQEEITNVIFLTQSEDDNEQGVMEKDENTRGGKRVKKPSLTMKEIQERIDLKEGDWNSEPKL